jgi:hypothetical protein
MSVNPSEFRQRAADLRRQAERATPSPFQTEMLLMADGYETLATEIEHTMTAKAKRQVSEGQADTVVVLLPARLSSVA